jgi:superfamily I DNA/RNA helicase
MKAVFSDNAEVSRVIGPPGAGKTTEIVRLCQEAVERTGPGNVMVISLTKAAANEVIRRETGVDEDMVGTLHSMCYRACDGPKLIKPKQLMEWNTLYPFYAMTDIGTGAVKVHHDKLGDELFSEIEINRQNLRPQSVWTEPQRNFFAAWTEWKESGGLWDFTDLLENAANETTLPPGSPAVLLADEAQDFSRLELAVICRWSMWIDEITLVGDPYQNLFEFRGSSKDAMDGDARILDQSYRLPKAAYKLATKIMSSMKCLPDIEFKPTVVEGSVKRTPQQMSKFRGMVPMVEEAWLEGRTVMIEASCEYMLDSPLRELRLAGIPFHNPLAPGMGHYNPLTPKLRAGQQSQRMRYCNYLRGAERGWTMSEVKSWGPLFHGSAYVYGGQKRLKEAPIDEPFDKYMLDIFKEEVIDDMCEIEMSFVNAHIRKEYRNGIQYMSKIYQRWGIEALESTPGVMIGTIHSLKGGEADLVILSPDLSKKWSKSYQRVGDWGGYDSVLRLFYVGVTRTKKDLIITWPSSPYVCREVV